VPEEAKPEDVKPGLQSLMQYSHLGMQFALTIGLLFYAGFWADGRWGTSPFLTMFGTFAGFGIGFFHLYRSVYSVRRR
jgi:hypothetical protein